MFGAFHEMVTGQTGVENLSDLPPKLVVFDGVREFPMRVKCATLSWHTLRAALDRQQRYRQDRVLSGPPELQAMESDKSARSGKAAPDGATDGAASPRERCRSQAHEELLRPRDPRRHLRAGV